MAVYTPPTENIPIFDPSVFPSSDGTALTIASGRKYFLTYPVAQGSEIFPSNITLQSTLTDSTGAVGTAGQFLSSTVTGTQWTNFAVAGDLDLPPPYKLLTDTITESASHVAGTDINLYGTTTDDDILIGSTLGAGHTLRLCNTTGGTSGGSVHCCNVGFDGSHINNATDPTTGILKIGQATTTGTLYIGGGANTAVHTTGPIIIGSDLTASGGINIGTGTNLTVPTTNTINIGQTSYTTNVNGPLTTTGLLTANGDITSPTITSTTKFKGIMYDAPTASSTLSLGETLTNGATSAVVPLLIGININGTPTTGIQIGNSTTKISLEGATTALSLATTSGSISSSSGNITTAGAGTISTTGTGGISTNSGNISSTSGNITTGGVGTISTTGTGTISTTSGSISSAGVITGASVISPSYNASAGATTVGICTTQTSGVLNVGTGARTTAGIINIGTGSGATLNPINIGGTGSTIALVGDTTLSKGLTLPSTTYTAGTGQLGYKATITGSNNGSITLPVTLISASTAVLRVVNLPIGYYIGTVSLAISNATVANDTITVSGSVSGCSSDINLLRFMGPLVGGTAIRAAGVFTGGFQVTSVTSTYTVSISVNSGSVSAFDTFFSYVRIA